MIDEFKKEVDSIYDIILGPIDYRYKLVAIHNLKKKFNSPYDVGIGKIYSDFMECHGKGGIIYTPKEISYYMIRNTITKDDIVNNPNLKVLDPACGCGNILIPCFMYLKSIFEDNLDTICNKNNIEIKRDDIPKHILSNNLYGFDTDSTALKVLVLDLFDISHIIFKKNLVNCDFLMEDMDEKYNVILGNPPYIGHKSIDREYSKKLKLKFKSVYKDKGDISYCFYDKALKKLKSHGKLTYITSRYFMESPSGEILRTEIKRDFHIKKIVDFYGIRPFKNVGIDPVIIFLSSNKYIGDNIEVLRPLNYTSKDELFSGEDCFKKFYINKSQLNDGGWSLVEEEKRNIIIKIERKCMSNLSEICDSFQGIITGCDKAFVVDKETILKEGLEEEIIKPWIKGKNIMKGKITPGNLYLIYSDLIKDVDRYPNIINHISKKKDRLLKRRECKNGVRKWYELQWGRNQDIFEGVKIVFPFKSPSNRFAVDKGSFFSADIYSLVLKENSCYTYDFILSILNSRLYEFYFKTFAKKLGGRLFDYYPNTIMKLCIPPMWNEDSIDEYSICSYFELTKSEIDIVKNSL